MAEPTTPKRAIRRRLSVLMLALHAVAAVAWLTVMPHAFPLGHFHFWLNVVLPIAMLAIVVASVQWRSIAMSFPAMWFASALAGIVVFPHDFRVASGALLLGAVAMSFTLASPLAFSRSLPRAMALGAMIGAIAPFLVKPGAPQTQPLNIPFASIDQNAPSFASFQQLNKSTGVSPNSAHVNIDIGRVRLDIAPLLTFTSRSIDGAPIIFASRTARAGPAHTLVGMSRPASDTIELGYTDDDESRLRVSTTSEAETVIEATSRLPKPIYSHLNAVTEIDLIGHKRLQLAFSPCGDARFDVTYSEYPRGKPARFAYFDAAHSMFRIVEATSAEKGPFKTLGEGPLRRGEALTIMLFDEGRAIGSVTFDDWSAQASNELSPTAGWNVPANAIEFSLYYEQPNSVAGIWLSLASTSVGRGWDTVGHAAGTYRNRMTIRRVDQ